MRKSLLIILMLVIGFGLNAQNWDVPEENHGMITKITASWCGPCGGWGWDGFLDLINIHSDDHICMALYGSNSSLFYTADIDPIAQEIGYGGFPNFSGNGEDVGTAHASVGGIISGFESAPVAAGIAYEISDISEEEVVINLKAEFFEEMEGTYLVAGYFIEDHVIGYQNGQGDSADHHKVFRGSFTEEDNEYTITTEGADEGEIFIKTLKLALNPEWNLDHSEIAVVLWNEDATNVGNLIYVNGSKKPQEGELAQGGGSGGSGGSGGGSEDPGNGGHPKDFTVGVDDVATESMELYPNPVQNILNIELSSASDFNIEVSDLLGKVVFSQNISSTNRTTVDVTSLPNGLYMVKVSAPSNTYLERVIVK